MPSMLAVVLFCVENFDLQLSFMKSTELLKSDYGLHPSSMSGKNIIARGLKVAFVKVRGHGGRFSIQQV